MKLFKTALFFSTAVLAANLATAQAAQPRQNNRDNAENVNALRQLLFGDAQEQKLALRTIKGKPTDTSLGTSCEIAISESIFGVYVSTTVFDDQNKYKANAVWSASRSAKASQQYKYDSNVAHDTHTQIHTDVGSQYSLYISGDEGAGTVLQRITLKYKTNGEGKAVTVTSVIIQNTEGDQLDNTDGNTPKDFTFDETKTKPIECVANSYQ